MTQLNPPETAPKDKSILGHFGWPWLVVAVWNPVQQEWATAQVEASMFEGETEFYFTTEWEKPQALIGWLPVPEVPKK